MSLYNGLPALALQTRGGRQLRKQRKRALDGLAKQVHTADNLGMGLIRTLMMRDHTSHHYYQPMLARFVHLFPYPPPVAGAISLQHKKY